MKKFIVLIAFCLFIIIGCDKKDEKLVLGDTLVFNLENRYMTFTFDNETITSVSLRLPFDNKNEAKEYIDGIKKDENYGLMYESITNNEKTVDLIFSETYYKEIYGIYNKMEVYDYMIRNGYVYNKK